MTRFYGAALAGMLLTAATAAQAGAPLNVETITSQALASEGYARALGKIDPDTKRAPISPDSWERIDTEIRSVTAAGGSDRAGDPNERPQYIVMTFKAKTDLYAEVANLLKTSIIRQVVAAGETTVIVADVTPHQENGQWTVQIEWRNRLPGGLPRSAFQGGVVKDSPEDAALQAKAKRQQDDAIARSMAEAEKQAAYNKQAEEARKTAMANIAKQNAEDTATMKATLEPLIGKWIPYTRIEYRTEGEPESDYRAMKIDRFADGKGLLTLLLGSEIASPRAQVAFTLENGALNFRDENCPVSIHPARDSGRVYMLYGSRECYALRQQVAIIPEERDLGMLDIRKATGVTMIKDGPGARVAQPRVDGTKLESADTQSPQTAERNRTAPRYDVGAPPR